MIMKSLLPGKAAGVVNGLIGRVLPVILTSLAVSISCAQYEVKEWANFEDGKLPEKMISIGDNWQQRMQVVAVDSITPQPEGFSKPALATYVLRLDAKPDPARAPSWQIGLAIGDLIDRSQIGPNGRAVFQADFFIEKKERPPSFAVLAM